MSDKWILYPCQMGEHWASIRFDHGIRDSIDTIAPPNLLKVRVAFKQAQPNGMLANEEFQSLRAFEEALLALIQQHESLYVGQITVDGHRHFYIYTSDSKEAWSAGLGALAVSQGYAIASDFRPDNSREGYWRELFPTEDDWQVIMDLGVIEALEEKGDDGTAVRQIDHWAYFSSPAAADQFIQWLGERSYDLTSSDSREDGMLWVQFSHDGTVQLVDITSHTIALRRKASELGGDYDGWETRVCQASG